jgi:hypothetical protein
MMAASRHVHLLDSVPSIQGRMQADAILGPLTWFRVGGPAEVLVRPSGVADLAKFLAELPLDLPLVTIGAMAALQVSSSAWHAASATSRSTVPASSLVPRHWTRWWPNTRPRLGWQGWNSCPGFPVPLAARS